MSQPSHPGYLFEKLCVPSTEGYEKNHEINTNKMLLTVIHEEQAFYSFFFFFFSYSWLKVRKIIVYLLST